MARTGLAYEDTEERDGADHGDPDRWVHKLDGEGRVHASFGRDYGEGAAQLFDPIGLAVDSTGRVYVADWLRGQGRVHGFAPDGRLLGTWSVGDDGQRLRRPQGGRGRLPGAAPRGWPRPASACYDHAARYE